MNFKEIPIFIISFNRLKELTDLVLRLEKDGYSNLNIIDNASTDEELLLYLRGNIHNVYFLEKNYGHKVLWACGLFKKIIEKNYYVVTDPDILPIEECPDNYIEYFYNVLQLYPTKKKVGFCLKLDDIPDYFAAKYDVIRWESFFYENKLAYNPLLYDADIDTTFALYRPGKFLNFYDAIRTGYPYMARHLGWYVNTNNLLQKEEMYFGLAKSVGGSAFYDFKIFLCRLQTINKIMALQRQSLPPWAGKSVKILCLILIKIYFLIFKFFDWFHANWGIK